MKTVRAAASGCIECRCTRHGDGRRLLGAYAHCRVIASGEVCDRERVPDLAETKVADRRGNADRWCVLVLIIAWLFAEGFLGTGSSSRRSRARIVGHEV